MPKNEKMDEQVARPAEEVSQNIGVVDETCRSQ